MEIPKTEAEIKEELRECWRGWHGDFEITAFKIGETRFKTIGWMLGFKSVDETAKWAGI